MSDWEDFCESMGISSHDPEEFFDLLEQWSKEEREYAVLAVGARRPALRSVFGVHADPHCSRCRGSGYVARYRHIEDGRCFQCLPYKRWRHLHGH